MKMPSILTNEDIETYYEKRIDGSLNLPRSFKNLRLGLLPRISQIFITLLKRNPNLEVNFFQLESTDVEGITELTEDPQSLTAILMSDKVFCKDEIENGKKRKVELKSNINQILQIRLNQSIHKKGHRVQLFAVDHSVPKYAYPSCFYSHEGSFNLKQSGYYSALIERFIDNTMQDSILSKDDLRSLGELIFELIENSDQHGKLDYENGRHERSVRALVIDHKMVTENQESSSIGGDGTAISEYLKGLRKSNRTVHFLEISLFDSGQGIVKNLGPKLNVNNSNINEEAKIISASFAKGVTSKADDKGFGRGLHNVRKVLNERNGFISMRTGKVALYRDFNAVSLYEKEHEHLSLYDESNKTNINYTELKSVEGLACSILVPLR